MATSNSQYSPIDPIEALNRYKRYLATSPSYHITEGENITALRTTYKPMEGAARPTGTCDFCGKKEGKLIQDAYVCDKKTCQKKAKKLGLRLVPDHITPIETGASMSETVYDEAASNPIFGTTNEGTKSW